MIICTLTQELEDRSSSILIVSKLASWWSLPYYTSKPQEQLLHAWVGGAECGVHYFEFAVVVAIELAFQVNSSWREVRRQLPPLQLCPSWRFEVSGCGFPTRPLALCMEQWKSKLITWKKGGFVRTRTNPPVSATAGYPLNWKNFTLSRELQIATMAGCKHGGSSLAQLQFPSSMCKTLTV